ELSAIDLLPSRLRLAEEFGATLTIDASRVPRAERLEAVRRQTDGRGVGLVVDCSGVAETFVEALELVRWGGTVIEAGGFGELGPGLVNPNRDVFTRNVCVLGVGGETADACVPAIEAMAEDLDSMPLERVGTHRL